MRDVFAPPSLQVLARLARSEALLAFDYDGTLAPIVEDPGAAWMRPRTRDLLAELARVYPCIVISGRTQDDALRRLRGVGVMEVIGNHGLEPWRRTVPLATQVREWVPVLERELAGQEGVGIEDKLFSVAVHYRRAPDRRQARAAIVRVASGLEHARLVGGKCVVNLMHDAAPHKGAALQSARERLGCDTALYVGDDATDEDVFRLDDPSGLVTVHVCRKPTSRATFFLRDQRAIDTLLERLVALRRHPGPAAGGNRGRTPLIG